MKPQSVQRICLVHPFIYLWRKGGEARANALGAAFLGNNFLHHLVVIESGFGITVTPLLDFDCLLHRYYMAIWC